MNRHELGSALFLLAFGVFGAVEAYRLTLGTPGRPGPGFFPFFLALTLVVVSIALTLQALRALARRSAAAQAVKDRAAGGPAQWPKVIYSLLSLLAYALLLETLGFLVTTILLMIFLFRAVEPQRWRVAVTASVGIAGAAYALFQWLGVRLPAGRWLL
jgi:putative tricarboxylic transport membrane protein